MAGNIINAQILEAVIYQARSDIKLTCRGAAWIDLKACSILNNSIKRLWVGRWLILTHEKGSVSIGKSKHGFE